MPNANVIYRGPVAREPQTIANLLVNGALLPGVFVTEDGTDLNVTAAGGLGRLLLLTNRRFFNQGPDKAYADNDTAIAYRIEADQEYSARAVTATYTKGDALTTDAAGLLIAAGTGDRVVAYVDTTEIIGATARIDVVIADSFLAAA